MPTPLRIVMIASECVPYAKTGGLADVVGSLPPVLRAMGHDVIVVMPRYGSIDAGKYRAAPLLRLHGRVDGHRVGVVRRGRRRRRRDAGLLHRVRQVLRPPRALPRRRLQRLPGQPAPLRISDARRTATLPGHGLCARRRPRPRLADGAGGRVPQDLALERADYREGGEPAHHPQHRLSGQVPGLATTTTSGCSGATSRPTSSRTTGG